MKPILSLCIPTYNRAAFLRASLEAALSQTAAVVPAGQVEIVVSDNASTDATSETLNAMRVAYPEICLRIHRQSVNLGPDLNIYETVQMARGEFIYIVSDDDVLLPGAVARLLELIASHSDLDAFALNIRSFSIDPQEENPRWFPVKSDKIVRGRGEALMQFHAYHIMFLSVFAFRRVLAVAQDHTDKAGTNLLQSYFLLDVLAKGRGLLVTAAPYLAQRKDNTGGWGFWRVMTTNLHDLLIYGERQGFAPSVIKQLLSVHLHDLHTSTLHFKLTPSRETFTPSMASYADGIRRLLRLYGADPFLLFILIPWMVVPSIFSRNLYRLYQRLKPLWKRKPPRSKR